MSSHEYVGLIFTVLIVWGGGFGIMLGFLKGKVSKDVCKVIHSDMDRNIEEIKTASKETNETVKRIEIALAKTDGG